MERKKRCSAFCMRIILVVLLMCGLPFGLHAADDLTSVDQIVEGNWYKVSTDYHGWTKLLSCKGVGQELQSIYSDGGCEVWMFEKTDDGYYYLHNFYGAYISAYSHENYVTPLTSTKVDAAKLNVSYDSGKGGFFLQNVEDTTYLSWSNYGFYYWNSNIYAYADLSAYSISEVEPNTTYDVSVPTTWQMQEGDQTDLNNHEHISQLKWKSNDESVATVDHLGLVKAVKEGEAVIIVNDTVTGLSAFTHVTVKNNPCEHKFDPQHDIMVKYHGGADMNCLFGSGYTQFLKENSYKYESGDVEYYYDIYVDGVKKDAQTSELIYYNYNGKDYTFNRYLADFTYDGTHTVILAPKYDEEYNTYRTTFTSIPDSMFFELWVISDEHSTMITYGGSIEELHIPATVERINNYNGCYCPKLRDIYYYGPYCEASNYVFDVYYDDINYYCGQEVWGEKSLYVKSDASPCSLQWNLTDCGFRLKSIDNPMQKVWIAGEDEKLLVGQTFSVDHMPDYIPIKYISSDESILSQSKYGLLANKVGKATVTVCAADGSPVAKTFEVEVVDDLNPIKVETVTITPSEVTLNANQKTTLSVSYLPENAGKKNVNWTSSDNNVAMVDNGLVVGINEGTCTITATATDGGGAYGECKVTVLVPDGIDNVNNDATTTESWYTLQGIKLSGRPAESGVYICNGKKVVVK